MRWARVISILVLTVTTGVGLLALWTPYGIDQALFVFGAKSILEGEVLYRDFWDIKPPGIFTFYALAGAIGGLSEPRVHLAELIWQLLLVAVLLRIALLSGVRRSVAPVAPLVAVATYYAWSGPQHLTQVEALVGLPIAVCLLISQRIAERTAVPGALGLFGGATGILALMKPLYAAFPLALLISALLAGSRGEDLQSLAVTVRRLVGPIALGIALIWVPVSAYFLLHGNFGDFVWTTFGYPGETLRGVPTAPSARLADSARWAGRIFLPYLPLILAGLMGLRRLRRPQLVVGVTLYLLLGALLILVQKTSWWEYHFMLLFPPLGLLACFGLDRILGLAPLSKLPGFTVVGLVGLLFYFPAADLAGKSRGRWRDLTLARRIDSDATLPVRMDPLVLGIWETSRFLRQPSESAPGPIYVFGDFRHQLLSQRRQAIAAHGHAWHHLPEDMWGNLTAQLEEAEPTYFFVGGYYRRFLNTRIPSFWRWVQRHYQPIRKFEAGHWYGRRQQPLRFSDRGSHSRDQTRSDSGERLDQP